MADRPDRASGLFARPDAPHRVHDLLLIAAYAAGDLVVDERRRAEALVEGCPECATLVADLRAIERSTAALPAAPRPRDFRLARADADRIKPSGMRRLVAAVTHPPLHRAQPLAAGLAMLGLTGLLVSTISFNVAAPSATGGSGGAAPGAAAPAPAATADGANVELKAFTSPPEIDMTGQEQAAGPAATDDLSAAGQPVDDTVTRQATDASADGAAPEPPSAEATEPVEPDRLPIALGSGALALAGLALFIVARRERRRLG